MKIFLLRHAKALDVDDDALRPLSPSGRKTVKALAEFIRTRELLKPLPVWHSRLVRATETAKLFQETLGWKPATLQMCDGLAPHDAPQLLAATLEKTTKDLLVVGHEPHLGKLASLLLTGSERPVRFKIRKCALLCLERIEEEDDGLKKGDWRLCWHLSPEHFD